jgi:hypothetical protein
MLVTNDQVVPSESRLDGVSAVMVRYQTGCPGCEEGVFVNGPAVVLEAK